jgi:hypothetical protein
MLYPCTHRICECRAHERSDQGGGMSCDLRVESLLCLQLQLCIIRLQDVTLIQCTVVTFRGRGPIFF